MNFMGLGLARKCLHLRWIAASRDRVAWLGVRERNFKAQDFYYRFDLNDLVNTSILPG